jgi:hypothetical protein
LGYYEKIQSRPGHRHVERRNGSGPSKKFNPPHSAIQHIRAAGKLTFTTLRGGAFRCNQINLGRLSATNVRSLREKVGAL